MMRNYVIAGATAAFLLATGSSALAQQQPSPAPAEAAPAKLAMPSFEQPEWNKVCLKKDKDAASKEICQTIRDLRTPFLVVSVQIGLNEAGKSAMTVMMPTGVNLMTGARVLVDGQTFDIARYRICLGSYCYADMPLTEANMASLRKGKKLQVQYVTLQGTPVAHEIGLEGFGKAFDSAGLSNEAYEALQKAYIDKLDTIFRPYIEAQQKAMQQSPGAATPQP